MARGAFKRRAGLGSADGGLGAQRLIKVFENVFNVLDAYAQPDRFWAHARVFQLFGVHLAVSGRRGVAGERLDVADD